VAAAAGHDTTCPEALDAPAGGAGTAGVESPAESRHVPLSCGLHDGVAQVRDPRSVYVLARATPAEPAAFRAPPSGWRIVGGVARSIRDAARARV
jgi:hypothetical protein